ncbi:hypothetical protein M8445_06615 [Deinococcus aquaticus]|uniref:Streptogramin lyase n=1 Tax=Deinococcus aquaticus TaxID=328692 RepID=A0ABY7V3V8_9DEIO|nr:hypothetical protein [Deinococcus aquaticus]WDA59868.1 hypothetical protein M8445_06615 [Deinococcus aquaticus]
MKRSLTALPTHPLRRPARGWRTPALLLAASLLLASCGGTGTPAVSGAAPGTGGNVTPGALVVSVEGAAVVGAFAQSGSLRVRSVSPAGVGAALAAGQAGAQLSVGTPVASGSDTLLPVTLGGAALASGGSVQLTVTAGTRQQTVTVTVLGSASHSIPAGTPYLASAARTQGQQVLLRAPASADEASRHSLMRFNPADATFAPLAFPVTGFETITSHAVSGTDVWVAVRGVSAEGSFLLRRGADGRTQRFLAGTVETLNNLLVLPDGRVAFTAYGQPQVLLLDPVGGAVSRLPTDGPPDSAALGTDGLLYFTRRGDAPAVMQVNPASGQSRAFPVGTPGVSVPGNLNAAPDGTLWFTESRTGSLWNLDPVSGKQRSVTLPTGTNARAGEVAVAPDGTVWAADTVRGDLLRAGPGDTRAVTIDLPAMPGGGPRALTVAAGGTLWFETGGQLGQIR